jgi:hypothetical protein
MKQLIYILFILQLPLLGHSQTMCNWFGNLVPIGDCCYEVIIEGGQNPDCAAFDELIVNTNGNINPDFNALITSATAITGISVAVDGTNSEAVFTSSIPFNVLMGGNPSLTIGTICLNGTTASGIVVAEFLFSSISDPTITYDTVEEEPTVCPAPTPGPFSKLVGDMEYNAPTRIHAYGDGVYVAGAKDFNGVKFASFTKFDISTGAIVWETLLELPSYFTDFAHVPDTDEFIVVGRTDPFQDATGPIDNRSIIYKYDDLGNIVDSKIYDQTGREGFSHIHLHTMAPDNDFPYYILGTKNPIPNPGNPNIPPPPSGFDQAVMYNIDQNLNVKWVNDYEPFNPIEWEASRGLYQYKSDLLITGNDIPDNNGLLIYIDGNSGIAPIGWNFVTSDYDLYELVEMPNSQIVIGGTDFATNQAVLILLDPNFNPLHVLQFPELNNFREIGFDSDGRIFAIGASNSGVDEFVIVRAQISGNLLTYDLSATAEDGEIDFEEGHLDVTPDRDFVYYADARLDNAVGFGGWDLFVGAYNLDLDNDPCLQPFPLDPFGAETETVQFEIRTNELMEPPFLDQPFLQPIQYGCETPCAPCPAQADFTFTVNCFTVDFTDASTGTLPLTYEWDFDCDGFIDATTANPTWVLPDQLPHDVCLRIIDADGCVSEFTDVVQAQDDLDPVLLCTDLFFPTDPGICEAFLTGPFITITDNCTGPNDFQILCSVNGVPMPNGLDGFYPKGDYFVDCVVTDLFGNSSTCSFLITVEDLEPPIIDCPDDFVFNVPACDGEVTIDLPEPDVFDNCPMVTYMCTLSGEQTFTCGTTTIVCTATDMAGNTNTCSYNVVVNCDCAAPAGITLSCTDDPNVYDFTVGIDILNNAPAPVNNCTAALSAVQGNVNFITVSPPFWGATSVGFAGTLEFTSPPIPLSIDLGITLDCDCADETCTIFQSVPVPCCDSISVEDREICINSPSAQIPLFGCNDLSFVSQVNWYVAPAPCPPGSWGDPYQTTNSCSDLILYPPYMTGDVCVYAEVLQGGAAGPCTVITSNIATIKLCEPISCSIGDQDWCYTGSPITPNLLTASLNPSNPDCTYNIQWFDDNGLINGATNLTYQPGALNFTLPDTLCFQDYQFTAVITDVCGTHTCTSTIRLYNEDAPAGDLYMDPLEPQPFCPGEDATLRYDVACEDDMTTWTWFISTDGTTYNAITDAGDINPVYNTNRLFVDTWYRIEKVNATCPNDVLDFFIDVKDPLSINSFTAVYDDPCAPTGVTMTVDFAPCTGGGGCNCDYTVEWYKDGILLQTTNETSTPATYTHNDPMDIPGNYYVIIQDNCCVGQVLKSDVVIVEEPPFAVVIGPCFRCNDEKVELEGIVENISGCTYLWTTTSGNITSDPLQAIITVDAPGTYIFQASCPDGCTYTASFDLGQCDVVGVEEALINAFPIRVQPNPTSDQLTIELPDTDMKGPFQVLLYDGIGQVVINSQLEKGIYKTNLPLRSLPAGVYTLMIEGPEGDRAIKKIVKQ